MFDRILDDLYGASFICPEKVAIRCGDQYLTYGQLWNAVFKRACKLLENDGDMRKKTFESVFNIYFVRTPHLVPLQATPSIDFLVNYFAIQLCADVPMPLENKLPADVWEQYQQKYAGMPLPRGTAEVLLTTGTTGKPKGVVISHNAQCASANNLVHAQGYMGITFIVCGPLNHLGSLSKVFATLKGFGTVVILDGMKDLSAFFTNIEKAEGKVATFLVPSSISMLLTLAEDQLARLSDKIKFIETGAAPISQSMMEHLHKVLPHTHLYNTYASTETGIVSTFDYSQECIAGCLGRPFLGSDITISSDGHVVCTGETLMTGYLDDPKMAETICLPVSDFKTADLGKLDEQGRLHLIGRDDDIINVGGYKVNPIEVEDAALSLGMVSDCICVAFTHPVMGTILKLLYVAKEGERFSLQTFAHALKRKLETYKVPQNYEQVDSIARTYNGKLDRKFYRK